MKLADWIPIGQIIEEEHGVTITIDRSGSDRFWIISTKQRPDIKTMMVDHSLPELWPAGVDNNILADFVWRKLHNQQHRESRRISNG